MNLTNNREVQLIDTTLRDGAQSPLVSFSSEDKLVIVSLLYKAGIRLFEAGIPVMNKQERDDMIKLKKRFTDCTFIGWCRASFQDIDFACKYGCENIHISFPTSSLHMKISGFDEDDILRNVDKLVKKAEKNHVKVSVGAQDASRAEPLFLSRFVKCAFDAGVNRIRIADTVGILSPLKTKKIIEDLMQIVPGKFIEFHGHNDLGMATANTLVALETGACFASVTVNGIGERAGNTALEEIVMAVKETSSLNINFNTNMISPVCKTVAKLIGCPIPANKPICGESIFLHKSGIHCNGLLKNQTSYEPFKPEKTGHSPSGFLAGTHSGSSGIRHMLGHYGESLSKNDLHSFVEKIHNVAANKKRSLSVSEVKDLFIKSVVSSKTKKSG